jgi:L-lactate dehydrogenase complex protein LldF
MQPTCRDFRANGREAMKNIALREAMAKLKTGFCTKRALAAERLPEFEALRDISLEIKNHVLANLDLYLEAFEAKVIERGGHVHWAKDAAQARQIILDICQKVGARTVTKSKSMVAEEIALNDFLEEHSVTPIETDLGEYIIQLRHEPPSHIIAPAIHLNRYHVADAFRGHHTDLDANRPLEEPRVMLDEARDVLRRHFLAADVGITGANYLIAETGSMVLVTNEGNADLTHTLPKVHIMLTGIEKVVPTLEDASTILRLLARSATGQEFSAYTTFVTGPKQADDPDGPEEFHVVLLDNGRSTLLEGEFRDVLRCIRCGACINHCPVYGTVGGHAYGWVYPGPIGSVLTPAFLGLEEARALPNASSLCGRCENVCPMRIPIPKMLRHWREREFASGLTPTPVRFGLAFWAFIAERPTLYRWASGMAAAVLGFFGREKGRFFAMPFASGWTTFRDLPAPQGKTFMNQWKNRSKDA